MGLKQKLLSLRSKLAEAAQSVLDKWHQDDDGYDEEFGEGGACDAISREMSEVVYLNIGNVQITDGGQDGDDHAFIIVYDESEAWAVDIPPSVYETGGGYKWRKIPDARVDPEDIIIWKVDRELIPDWD